MRKKLLGVLMLAVLPVLAFAGVASAQTFRSGQSTSVTASETIDGSAWMSGANIDVAGTVDGDLYCAGQNITISGHITGDVLCAGQTVTLSGTVDGSARLAGQTVAISGDVKASATEMGQSLTLDGQGNIGRDASFFGQTVAVNGKVGRDAVIGASSVSVNSAVGRNVTAWTNDLTVKNSATIGGFLTYTSPQKGNVESGAQIAGKVTYNEKTLPQSQQAAAGISFVGVFIWLLMLIVSAVVMALLFPREYHVATSAAVAAFPKMLLATLVGLIAGIVMPFVVIFLAITILGIPLAIVAVVAWVLILLLSGSVSAYYVGRIVWRDQTHPVLIMLIGAAIIAALLVIPLINIIVWFIAVWYGSGTILLELKRLAVAPRYDVSPKPGRKQRA
jgi:cytoskeletal protein CcmA (bactofilin family)